MSKSSKMKKVKSVPRESRSGKTKWECPIGSDWEPSKPSKYKPEYCKAIIKHCHGGNTFEEFASSIGVHLDTLYEWAQQHPEFSEAKKLAKQEALIWMMAIGKKAMMGERVGPEGKSRAINWPLWIFKMKARFGWREEQESNDDGDVDFDFT